MEVRAIGTHEGEFLKVAGTGALVLVSGVSTLSGESTVRRASMTLDFGGVRRQLLQAAGPE